MEAKRVYTHVFNYEIECRAVAAPKDGIGEYLDGLAQTIAGRRFGGYWEISKGKLEQQKNGTHKYYVTLLRIA